MNAAVTAMIARDRIVLRTVFRCSCGVIPARATTRHRFATNEACDTLFACGARAPRRSAPDMHSAWAGV